MKNFINITTTKFNKDFSIYTVYNQKIFLYNPDTTSAFECEKIIYTSLFSEYANESYNKTNSGKKMNLYEYWKKAKKPVEFIAELPLTCDINNIWNQLVELVKDYNDKYKSNSLILSMGIIKDNTSYKLIIHRILFAKNSNGQCQINESRALEEMFNIGLVNNNSRNSFNQKFIKSLNEILKSCEIKELQNPKLIEAFINSHLTEFLFFCRSQE